jgi:hypothetical protein
LTAQFTGSREGGSVSKKSIELRIDKAINWIAVKKEGSDKEDLSPKIQSNQELKK